MRSWVAVAGLSMMILLSGCTGNAGTTIAGTGEGGGEGQISCDGEGTLTVEGDFSGPLEVDVLANGQEPVYDAEFDRAPDGPIDVSGTEGTWMLDVDADEGVTGEWSVNLKC